MSREEARLRQRIGAGCSYPYFLAGEQGVLRLTLAQGPRPPEMSHWQTGIGTVQLSAAQPVLSLMSGCPTFALLPSSESQAWYWPWWNQQLSAELLALFSHLAVEPEKTAPGELLLTLTLEWGGQRAHSLLSLSAQSLALLITKPGWQQDAWPLPESMMLTLPVITGELELSSDALQALRCGDVLLPLKPGSPLTDGVHSAAVRAGFTEKCRCSLARRPIFILPKRRDRT
ncbi:hypothetical protein [Erwinia sp. E_sp_W01_6]|uniref:hypothetical protein n=1 Tax=Erwinia sp. E_sp_W01_6 TaxID=3039408 RepID=UPI0030D302A1